ncbi:MAG: tetratricopeptide repeat protein [Bacteroidales bacterium]|nr:tetratricopeptide repeat protein [Bacteroidales bacterium]
MKKLFLILLLLIPVIIIANNNIDSLKKELQTATDTNKISILLKLTFKYLDIDVSQSVKYGKQALELSENINYKMGIAQSLNGIGNTYQRKSLYDKALEYFNKALQIFKEIGFDYGIFSTLNNIGAVFEDKGDYGKALEYLLQSLKIIEEIGNSSDIAMAYNNIGLVHYYQLNLDKALEYHNKALDIRIKINNKKGQALSYNNIGIVYYYKKDYEKVLEYFQKSLTIYKDIGDLRGQSLPLFNIGQIYNDQGRIEEALEYFNKSLKIDKQLENRKGEATTLNYIGQVYANQKEFKKALGYQKRSLKIAKEIDAKPSIQDSYEILSETYEKMNNYKESLFYHKLYSELKDSLFNETRSRQIADMQTKYETAKKEEEIDLLNKEDKLKELELISKIDRIKKQKLIILIAGLSLIIIIVFSILLFRLFQLKRKANKLLAKNINQINKQNKELEKAYEEIKNTTKLKEIFLANTSHEIRTPLNVIIGFTNLLMNSQLGTKQLAYLKNIKNSGNNLLVVINDLLTFSKIESGKLSLEKINFDLKEIVINYIETITEKTNKKKIELIYDIDSTIPKLINGDPIRLNQILSNMIGNAIKFTNEGGEISINISLSEENEDNVIVLFKIFDTGIGIPKEKLENIFDSFTQARSDTTRKFGGTGLGLSIVKKLVELHNGKISVESKKNEGSVFIFDLKYAKTIFEEGSEKTETFKIIKVKSPEKINILLAEDNEPSIILTIDTLKLYNENIKIDVAKNGKQAIEKAEKNNYDLIIMDVQMPEMDGYDATDYIRENFKQPKNTIPILGMSAYAFKEEKEKCLNIGMNDYITKPFVPEKLFEKIEKLTGLKQKEIKEPLKILKNKFEKLKIINLSFLKKIYKNNNEKIIKMIKIYLKNIPDQLSELKNMYNENNFSGMKIIAHSLKTSFNYIGMKENRELMKKIEEQDISETSFNEIIEKIDKNWEQAKIELNKIIQEIS